MASNQVDIDDAVWDVVIVGAGPAGAATAITLASLGQSVLLVDDQLTRKYKLGESLPPASVDLVQHFVGNLEETDHQTLGLYRTAGNISSWSSEQIDHTDFFFTTTGYGLCVDRLAFDRVLRLRAVAVGASFAEGLSLECCTFSVAHSSNWRLTFRSSSKVQQCRARYLVDCSGRRAVVAKLLGVPMVENEDQLFAYAQWFSKECQDDDQFTRIEAVAGGWWYTSRLPSDNGNQCERLVVFHTDRDLSEGRQAGTQQGFEQLLNESVQIQSLLKEQGYKSISTIRGAPANSQRLREFCGDAWMAVGDSAQAYDPLSSQGIDKALRTASQAGHLIHYALSESAQGPVVLGSSNQYIQQYQQQQQQLWDVYTAQRDYYYGIQTRWLDQPFWQRRQ